MYAFGCFFVYGIVKQREKISAIICLESLDLLDQFISMAEREIDSTVCRIYYLVILFICLICVYSVFVQI